MKFRSRPDSPVLTSADTVAPLRLDRRTGMLLQRLRPGDIAVVDLLDLDGATAEALAEAQVSAVVNASAFISGRFPNRGPDLLMKSGVRLVEEVGTDIFRLVTDGTMGRIADGTVYIGDQPVAHGVELSAADVEARMHAARGGLSTQLTSLTHNTTEFLRREQGLLLHGEGVPDLSVDLRGRPAVVVVAAHGYRADLHRLRRYIAEQHPVLIGVDRGADALLESGHRVDVMVAGPGSFGATPASELALRSAKDVVVHTDESGRVLGAERVAKLGIRPREISGGGATGDVALLLADLSGASVVVGVGTHATLGEFLDRQRDDLASAFLTRLRVGPKLVDARSVEQLYAGRVRLWHLVVLLLVGLVAVAVAIGTTPVGQDWWDSFRDWTGRI